MSRAALALLVVLVIAAAVAAPARPVTANEASAPAGIGAFFGHYEGRSLFPMGEARNREFVVSIEPYGPTGFVIEWLTVLDTELASQAKTQRAALVPASAEGVFVTESGVATGPALINEPIVWAKLAGPALTVHVLTVVENGDYVVQTYVRTLTPSGLALDFTRVRSGTVERTIKGTLKRIDGGLPPPEIDGGAR